MLYAPTSVFAVMADAIDYDHKVISQSNHFVEGRTSRTGRYEPRTVKKYGLKRWGYAHNWKRVTLRTHRIGR